ncbi:MAG TPA: Gfo/Idh/MocA family oxidoreductase [Candidatus Limnocylindrales bacterium]
MSAGSSDAAAGVRAREPLRIGILGAATIAENAIVTPAHVTGARLVAVAARDRARAATFAADHGVERVLDSYAEIVNDPEVEAIYNPLPNGLHAPWNLAAIAAGKHVLSEKPFASNAEEAVEVRDAGVRAGVVVVDGFHYLYHPVTKRLHELIASGELGEVQRVEVTMITPAPEPENLRWSYRLAGGALMDLGCYSLHAHRVLAPWLGGAPSLVAARAGERAGLPGVDEWVDADLVFPSGATGLARCNMAGEKLELTYRIAGSRGEAMITNFIQPHLDDRIVVRTAAGERVEHMGTRSSYTYQLDAFAAFVRDGIPMPTDSNDAVVTMELIDEVYRAVGLGPRPRSPRVI